MYLKEYSQNIRNTYSGMDDIVSETFCVVSGGVMSE